MNRFENWFCGSRFWRAMTRRQVLPWLLQGTELGEHLLEIGAGPGAATEELRKRAGRVTSLEYSRAFAAGLAQREARRGEGGTRRGEGGTRRNGAVVQGDASALPFTEKTFSAAIAVLVLHHLRSREAQERAFAEAFRVLRPGGVFLALEIRDGWVQRVSHVGSTFVAVGPESVAGRLGAAGFAEVRVERRGSAYRVKAKKV